MTNWREIHNKYSAKLGSDYIATPKALRIIEKSLKASVNLYNAKEVHVIEIGTGIGTIADFISGKFKDVGYIAYETDSFCINSIMTNLSNRHVNLITNFDNLISQIVHLKKSCLILIVDDYLNLEQTRRLVNAIRFHDFKVIIEGHRFEQRKFFVKCLYDFDSHSMGNSSETLETR
ncbi:MAG: hypothetical protein EB122_06275 [Actinobacteria bacterium]|nr:hypothetical protein [Actinomycetota bacterium]